MCDSDMPLQEDTAKRQLGGFYLIVLFVIIVGGGAAIAMARAMDDAKSQHAPSSTVQCFHDN